MKKSILLLAFILCTISNINAQDKIKLQGNGKVVSETRSTGDYDGVKIAGFFDVDLVSGKEGKITIKGEENLLSAIKVEVEDKSLKIYIEKGTQIRTSSGNKIQVTVPFEKISELSLAGSGDIQSKDVIKNDNLALKLAGSGNLTLPVDTNNLELHVSGSGNIHLKGTATKLTTKLSGSGDIDASSLKSKIVEANVSGSGNSKVTCDESITARVAGSGNIKYIGNPEKRDVKVSGSGTITKG
ncbi:Putative auto-transporter adhesin, head GIN domain [Flavobacterium anhuiense]|uniref:Auto-transporter adhesin, head GIN domain n=1 Tax=Flavobacterium anhuiense TaxID=459526 RepID=A0ABY0LQV9_9FLAO|nr:head GIN domain-containing protein [Flavobacterium anhuiense]SCY39023.1 Putative auto-transporter adhesin, head GIN domain [Flavobacterium anhuiense]